MRRDAPRPWAAFGARMRWVAVILSWRIGHVARRATERAARGLLRVVIRHAVLRRRLPRRLVALPERLLVRTSDRPVFDGDHYLARNPDVAEAGVAPLRHYLRWGWAEGRDPAPRLDERRYRRQAGLGPADRVSALGHYLAVGRARGLGPPEAEEGGVEGPGAEAAAEAALAALMRLEPRATGPAEVDVIVPVYRGRAETLRCLLSVLRARNRTPYRLVVIDDRGPEHRLRADLARLARRGLIELVVQPRNRGFVAAVNRGMALHPERDVIWLNADTEVWGDWIDRLRRAAYGARDVATVTPLTNNGTICSCPRFNADNPRDPECGWEGLDRLAARVNAGRVVEAPTCVGFCTYVRRAAIEEVGMLDEVAFGRGYGEENDFSQRAIKRGWRNLITGDVFVRHLGQTSFRDARARRVAAAMGVMERRHPGYLRAVERFIAADPPGPLRRNLDLARLRLRMDAASPAAGTGAAARGGVLLVSHSLGGGTRRHVHEELVRLESEGRGVALMTGAPGGAFTARIGHPALGPLPSLEGLALEPEPFRALLDELEISEIHVHHLADFGGDAGRFSGLLAAAGRPYEVVVHDYLALCPRINLVDAAGFWCGEPDESGCRRCLLTRRSPFGALDIGRWRAAHGALLAGARTVRVPDRSVAERLRRYFPALPDLQVRPHEAPRLGQPNRPGRRRGPWRIATLGAIGPVKGFDVLVGLASEARRRDAPVSFSVIGHTRNDRAALAAGLRVTGRYRERDVPALIAAEDPDLILIPSTWPETYCYTLSHALASGRPVAGFDIGAVATRLRAARERGHPAHCLPLALARTPEALLDALLELLGEEKGRGGAARQGEPAGPRPSPRPAAASA